MQNDPVKIFQRAFWASPTSEDKILHAERREWADQAGISRWQWFLVVDASPGLRHRLREENAFGLSAAPAPPPRDPEAPLWFTFDPEAVDAFHNPRSHMQILYSKTGSTLFATDSGDGFRPGAPEPNAKATGPSSAGRFPSTPPPRPHP